MYVLLDVLIRCYGGTKANDIPTSTKLKPTCTNGWAVQNNKMQFFPRQK